MADRKAGESVSEWIDRVVQQFAVVIFSKTYCPFCTMAKREITTTAKSISGWDGALVFELDTMREGSEIQAELKRKTGRSTVPNVFVNGKSVGGGDDVTALSRKKQLTPMIQAAVTAISA